MQYYMTRRAPGWNSEAAFANFSPCKCPRMGLCTTGNGLSKGTDKSGNEMLRADSEV